MSNKIKCIPPGNVVEQTPFSAFYENLTLVQNDSYVGNNFDQQTFTLASEYSGMSFGLSALGTVSGTLSIPMQTPTGEVNVTLIDNNIVLQFSIDNIPNSTYYFGGNTTFAFQQQVNPFGSQTTENNIVQFVFKFVNFTMSLIRPSIPGLSIGFDPSQLQQNKVGVYFASSSTGISSLDFWVSHFYFRIDFF